MVGLQAMLKKIETLIKKILTYALPIVAIVMLGFTVFSISYKKIRPPMEIKYEPPKSIFTKQIAGVGIIEPRTSSRDLSPYVSGVVTKIYAIEGEKVSANQKLFTIDDRELLAESILAQAKMDTAKIHYDDLHYNYNLFRNLGKSGTVSKEEISKKKFAMLKAKSQYAEAIAEYNILKTKLNRMTISSPIDGDVLQSNISVGEYASASSNSPAMIVGNLRDMKVNVTVDETDIPRFNKFAKAYGIIRGTNNKRIPLKFARIQPKVIPKKHLTNDPSEKIDTRVLEIVYFFDNKNISAYPGQQMDVFIEDKQ